MENLEFLPLIKTFLHSDKLTVSVYIL